MLTDQRSEFPPAIDPAQPDLSARHEAKEEDHGRVFGR
jgi:hypothetical protein